MRKLLLPHAPPKASLPEGTCSPVLARRSRAVGNHGALPHTPLLGSRVMPHLIDKYAGAVLATRSAGGWPVSGQMLSRAVRQRSRAVCKHGAPPHTPLLILIELCENRFRAVGRVCASICSLANWFSAPRAGLASVAVPSFGLNCQKNDTISS